MSNPQISSMELSTGNTVPLSFDFETGTPIEIYLTGSNLNNLDDIQLDSGPGVAWYITGISSNGNSAIITAYATGETGSGYLDITKGPARVAGIPIDDFWIPFIE